MDALVLGPPILVLNPSAVNPELPFQIPITAAGSLEDTVLVSSIFTDPILRGAPFLKVLDAAINASPIPEAIQDGHFPIDIYRRTFQGFLTCPVTTLTCNDTIYPPVPHIWSANTIGIHSTLKNLPRQSAYSFRIFNLTRSDDVKDNTQVIAVTRIKAILTAANIPHLRDQGGPTGIAFTSDDNFREAVVTFSTLAPVWTVLLFLNPNQAHLTNPVTGKLYQISLHLDSPLQSIFVASNTFSGQVIPGSPLALVLLNFPSTRSGFTRGLLTHSHQCSTAHSMEVSSLGTYLPQAGNCHSFTIVYLSRPTQQPTPTEDCTTTNIVLGIPCPTAQDPWTRVPASSPLTSPPLFQTIGFTGNCPPISLIRENAQPYHDRPPGTLPTAGTHSIYLLNPPQEKLPPPRSNCPQKLPCTLHPVLARDSYWADLPTVSLGRFQNGNYTPTQSCVAMEEATTIHDVSLKNNT
eukprot:gene5300-18544_t